MDILEELKRWLETQRAHNCQLATRASNDGNREYSIACASYRNAFYEVMQKIHELEGQSQ